MEIFKGTIDRGTFITNISLLNNKTELWNLWRTSVISTHMSAVLVSFRKGHLGRVFPSTARDLNASADRRKQDHFLRSQSPYSRFFLQKSTAFCTSIIEEEVKVQTSKKDFWQRSECGRQKSLSPGESNPALSRDRGRCYRYTREDRS